MVHLICDLVFMVGNFILAPALFFSIRNKVRMPVKTTLPTAIVLTAFTVAFVLKELYLAAFACGLTTTCWYILYFRR